MLASVDLPDEAAQIRLYSGGVVAVRTLPQSATVEQLLAYPAVLTAANSTLDPGPEYRSIPIPPAVELWKPLDIFQLAFGVRSLDELRRSRASGYRMLVRAPAASAPAASSTVP